MPDLHHHIVTKPTQLLSIGNNHFLIQTASAIDVILPSTKQSTTASLRSNSSIYNIYHTILWKTHFKI